MANTLSLVQWLAAGVVTTAGADLASGKVRFYQPGTLTPTNVYSDDAGSSVITQPLTLSAGGRSTVYTLDPCRMIIKDAADTSTLFDVTLNLIRDDQIYVTSAAFNGGTETTLETILDGWTASAGGATGFWRYKQSGSATERNLKDWMSEALVSVKDFGAVGDDATDNLTPFNNAITAAIASGAGGLKIPAGTYRVSAQIFISTGLKIYGDGPTRTIVKNTAAGQCFNSSAAPGSLYIADLAMAATGTGSIGISGNALTMERVAVSGHTTGVSVQSGSTLRGVAVTIPNSGKGFDATTSLYERCSVTGVVSTGDGFSLPAGAGYAPVFLNCTTATVQYSVRALGTFGGMTLFGCDFGQGTTIPIRLDAGATSGYIHEAGSVRGSRQPYGNLSDASTADNTTSETYFDAVGRVGLSASVANGGTFTIFWDTATTWSLTGAGATATVTVNGNVAATPPAAGKNVIEMRLLFRNAAGGTAWTLNATFKVSAAPSAAASAVTGYTFLWDGGFWRETGRGVT
jgi:Pectate lyase superfamily protein